MPLGKDASGGISPIDSPSFAGTNLRVTDPSVEHRRFPSWLLAADSEIPCLIAGDPALADLIGKAEACVIVGAVACKKLAAKWDFAYLEKQMAFHDEWTIHVAPPGQGRFQRVYGKGVGEGAVVRMSFADFSRRSAAAAAAAAEPADSEHEVVSPAHALYLQEPLIGAGLQHRGYGPEMAREVDELAWSWMAALGQGSGVGVFGEQPTLGRARRCLDAMPL